MTPTITPAADQPVVVQMPVTKPAQLMLLFHGVGSVPRHMAPLGERLAGTFPQAAIVSLPAWRPCDLGHGRQWFSVQGITDENRTGRIDEAMPAFAAAVREWQARTGADVEATALVGFSQGAIMALASTQALAEPLAGRIVALAGRFAAPPDVVPEGSTLHFIHGKADAVVHYGHTVSAAERLVRLGADLTADVIPHLGHEVTPEVADLLIERLTTHIPQRRWREAMAAAPRDDEH